MRLYNIPEQTNGNLDDKVVLLCNRYLDTSHQLTNRSFERIHRLGTFKTGNCRTVIVRVPNYKDKVNILKLKKVMLDCEKVSMSEDYSKEVELKSKKLYPVMAAIRSKVKQDEKTQIYIKEDKLMVREEAFTTNELDKLPEEINLQKLFTPQKGTLLPYSHSTVHFQTIIHANSQLVGINIPTWSSISSLIWQKFLKKVSSKVIKCEQPY